jgi:hypothetical protein
LTSMTRVLMGSNLPDDGARVAEVEPTAGAQLG